MSKFEKAMHHSETTVATRRAVGAAASGPAGRAGNGRNDGHAAVLRTWLAGMSEADKAYRPRRRGMA